jgi:PAS domain S-box-containing protein
LWPALAREGIRSVAFIPLLGIGGVIGKFMLYYNQPHEFRAEELQIAQTIATHVAFATERRNAETALQVSEERFRATFFQAAVGITQANLSGELRLVNDRFCEILGYSRAEMLGKTFLELTHPDYREACLHAIHQLLNGETVSYSTEKRFLRKDGASVWARVNVSLVRDQDNQPQYFIGVVEDTTERIQAERALRESEQRLTLALSAARLGVWNCDLREKTVALSPGHEDIVGSPRTYAEWTALIHPEDRPRVLALVEGSVAKRNQPSSASIGGGKDPLGALTRCGTAGRRRRGVSPGGSQPRYYRAQTSRSGSARKRSALPQSGGYGAGHDVDNRSGQALHVLQ